MDIYDKIEKFQYSYFVLNKNQYRIIKGKFDKKRLRNDWPRDCDYCILGWDENKPMLFSYESMLKKTFKLYKGGKKSKSNEYRYDLSFLDRYKTDDRSIFLQSDKVIPNTDGIDQLYAIDHIWLAYVYTSKSGIKRMCLNRNLFGVYKLIGTREMNLREILLDL